MEDKNTQNDLRGELPKADDNVVVNGDMSNVVRDKLRNTEVKPMVRTTNIPTSERTKLENAIEPLDTIVKTGEPLPNNKIVSDSDRTSVSEISDIVSKQIQLTKQPPVVIDGNSLSDSDRARLIIEEDKRRDVNNERFKDLEIAFEEEQKRRLLFDEQIKVMKSEFELFLKKTFPQFVGERNIKDSDIQRTESEVNRLKEYGKLKVKDIQKKQVERLEREKERKLIESNLKINKLTRAEVQTFFEEELIIEQKQKLSLNPEIENLNEVQKTLKEIGEAELRLGRKIIPHRDIVESEDSDFDVNSYTKPTDILIKESDK
jgi:hypothetical protein